MLKWGICAVGAILALWGLWWGYSGYSVVEVERGWSALLSGATVFSAGAMIMAIGALMSRIDALIAAVKARPQAIAADVVSASAAPPAPLKVELSPPKDTQPVKAPPRFVPPTVTSANAPPPVAANEPGPPVSSNENVRVTAAASLAGAAAVAAVTASLSSVDEDTRTGLPDGGAENSSPEAPAGSTLPVAAHDEPEEPYEPEAGEALIPSGPESVAATKAAQEGTTAVTEELAPPLPERAGHRRAAVPVPQLAPAPVHAEWPDAPPPPRDDSAQPPVRAFTPSRASLPPRPAAGLAATGLAAAAAAAPQAVSETPAAELMRTGPSAEANGSVPSVQPEPQPSVPVSEPETQRPIERPPLPESPAAAEPVQPSEQPEWVGKLFEELDQLNETGQDLVALPPPSHTEERAPELQIKPEPAPVSEPAVEIEKAELRPSEAPVEYQQIEPEEPRREEPAGPVEAAEEPPAGPERAMVRSYESQGVTYHLYDDGSIDADTSGGRFHFGSLDELREFIAKRST